MPFTQQRHCNLQSKNVCHKLKTNTTNLEITRLSWEAFRIETKERFDSTCPKVPLLGKREENKGEEERLGKKNSPKPAVKTELPEGTPLSHANSWEAAILFIVPRHNAGHLPVSVSVIPSPCFIRLSFMGQRQASGRRGAGEPSRTPQRRASRLISFQLIWFPGPLSSISMRWVWNGAGVGSLGAGMGWRLGPLQSGVPRRVVNKVAGHLWEGRTVCNWCRLSDVCVAWQNEISLMHIHELLG